TCQSHKGSTRPSVGTLQLLHPPAQPFDQIGVDFLCPFPFSQSGNLFILASVDYLTRYAETRAVSDATGSTAADFYVSQIVLRHGAPSRLVTDRGSPFISRTFRAALDGCYTQHCPTTAYH